MSGPISIEAVLHQLPIFMNQTEENAKTIHEILLELRTISMSLKIIEDKSHLQDDRLESHFKQQTKMIQALTARVAHLENLKYYLYGIAVAIVAAVEVARFLFFRA